MPFLSIREDTLDALNLHRLSRESDDQLINRILEHARSNMIIKGATPTETTISTALSEKEDIEAP